MKKILFISLFSLFTICTAYSQIVKKVVISGTNGNTVHDNNVRISFLAGYSAYDGSQYTGDIVMFIDSTFGIANSFAKADSVGAPVIIRSYLGLYTAIDISVNYPNILLFMPAGTNNFTYIFGRDIATCTVVVTGAGILYNLTGYEIEFFGLDVITSGGNASSFSNGYIAGQLAFIANKLNVSMQQARQYARQYGTALDLFNGYGAVNTSRIMNGVLPVEFSSFTAVVENNLVKLNWKTATEVNNYGFEIERSSDQKNWLKVGFIQGHGNSNSPKEYSFTDQPAGGISFYYRLKQIDTDGKFDYSKTLQVSVAKPSEMILSQNYPNPFNPTTSIKYEIPTESNVSLKVYDVLGREVAILVEASQGAGSYTVNFDASKLSSGMYFYTLRSGNLVQSKKMNLIK